MDSSIVPAAALTVTSLVNNLVSSVKNARELSKQSSDSELKEQIADIYDAIVDVKARVLDLDTENRSLREQLAQKASVKHDPNTKGFYKEGEIDPLCPKCFQSPTHDVVYLRDEGDQSGYCVVCRTAHSYLHRRV